MAKFNVGDVVVLKSEVGFTSPIIMTVEEIEGNYVTCVWRVKEGFSKRDFPEDVLTSYKVENHSFI